ncbi:hypothetical protein [Micromonospora sp. WMMD1082]|uniref:hypothetical protein n=1 Tax=Micromonospora sp. WMMD1082 TaxID=3016104 RepID=UPI0024159BDE|nr:hypothetical protein [Micromonospora sp. WMMD1082]MDG4795711.1 hypothetical protein [Micromonospora sp. WMMD1082]
MRRAVVGAVLSLTAVGASVVAAPTTASAASPGQVKLCNYTGNDSVGVHGRFQRPGNSNAVSTRVIGNGQCWSAWDISADTHVSFYTGNQLIAQQYYRPGVGLCWLAATTGGRIAAFSC